MPASSGLVDERSALSGLRSRATQVLVPGCVVEGHVETVGSRRAFSIPQRIADELDAHLLRTGSTAQDPPRRADPRWRSGRATNLRLRATERPSERPDLKGDRSTSLRHSAVDILRTSAFRSRSSSSGWATRRSRTMVDSYGSLPENVDRAAPRSPAGSSSAACGADVVQDSSSENESPAHPC